MKHLFIQEGFYCSGMLNFSPREAYREAMENNAILVDVREEYLSDYKKFTVPQTLFLPFSLFLTSNQNQHHNHLLQMRILNP